MIRRSHCTAVTIAVILTFPLLTYSEVEKSRDIKSSDDALLSVEHIAFKAVERTKLRDSQFKRYSVDRTYEIKTEDKKPASVINARMTYSNPPAAKNFRIISKTNNGTVGNLVYEHAIKAEKEALDPKNETAAAISPDNYAISLQGKETIMDVPCYVLEITPKRTDRMLVKGRIWVSAVNFDTVRIEGEPVKSPSLWIRKMTIVRQFQNVNGFWFPMEDISTVDVRIFGEVKVQIRHQNYDIKL